MIWSKDVGEKKSELIDALSKLETDSTLLRRYEEAEKGHHQPAECRRTRARNVEADTIAVAKPERTLRSWRLTQSRDRRGPARGVRVPAAGCHGGRQLGRDTGPRPRCGAPFDGVIMGEEHRVGDIVDPTQDLVQGGGPQRLQVLANVYEENLPTLLRLTPTSAVGPFNCRRFPTRHRSRTSTSRSSAKVIDPTQHTGTVMGLVDNPWDAEQAERRFQVGQFITATIDLAPDPTLVAVPGRRPGGKGKAALVFVQPDPARTEITARQVAVVRRGQQRVFVRREPWPAEQRQRRSTAWARRASRRGQRLELSDELENLKSTRPSQSPRKLRTLPW